MKFAKVINHEGNVTTLLTIKTIYNCYIDGKMDKQQAINFLYDWGIVSSKELKEANGINK